MNGPSPAELRTVRLPAAEGPRVSIVVVTAKDGSRLLRCLAAVAREAPADVPLEVVVVLNAAEPDVHAAVDREVERAIVVSTDVPLGLAGGLNLGAEQATGELLHFLHDDVEVCPGWLDALAAALEQHPGAGAAGSVVIRRDGSLQSAGGVLWRDGATTLTWTGPPPDPASLGTDPFPVDYCGSASLLIRRELWETLGGADEEFHPAYYVDADLAMAIRSRGYDVLCVPRSRVYHVQGGSSRLSFRLFLTARNRTRFVSKWESALADHEPFDYGQAPLQRARERTRRRSAALEPTPVTRRATERATDLRGREREFLRRDLEVKTRYVAKLEAELDRLEGELDAIKSGGWWRLRSRVFPLLRVLGALRRLLSRPGSTSRTG